MSLRLRGFVRAAAAAASMVACSGAVGEEGATNVASSEEPLVGGRLAERAELPATVHVRGGCTAAKVGARLFLLAAHCVHDTERNGIVDRYKAGARFPVTSAKETLGAPYTELTVVRTHVAPGWLEACEAPCAVNVLTPAHPSDAAVVEVAEETPAIAVARVDARPVAVGDRVTLSGYGCEVSLRDGFGGGAPRHKVSSAVALAADVLTSPGSYVAASDADGVASKYVITPGRARDKAAASLCFGDSGGPLYRERDGEALVVGVNAYYTFPEPYEGISATNWHTRLDASAPGGVLAWLEGLGASVRRDDGAPRPAPAVIRLEAEGFDPGGQGVGYSDTDAANRGGAHRAEGVDLEATTDEGGGFNVGWTAPGEWLQLTTTVAATGTYDLRLRVAAVRAGKRLHVEVDGRDVTGPVTVPQTGCWQAFRTVVVPGVRVEAGQRRVRVVFDTDGTNLNWVELAASAVDPRPGQQQQGEGDGEAGGAGSSGDGDAATKTPCTDLCAAPAPFAGASFNSGNLGTFASCRVTTAALAGMSCGNFAGGRVLRVNGVAVRCDGSGATLPAPRNGGYCLEATAGAPAWGWFATW